MKVQIIAMVTIEVEVNDSDNETLEDAMNNVLSKCDTKRIVDQEFISSTLLD